jgi:hypothetical protein
MVYLTNFKDILTKEIVPQLKTKLLTSTLPAIAGSAGTLNQKKKKQQKLKNNYNNN